MIQKGNTYRIETKRNRGKHTQLVCLRFLVFRSFAQSLTLFLYRFLFSLHRCCYRNIIAFSILRQIKTAIVRNASERTKCCFIFSFFRLSLRNSRWTNKWKIDDAFSLLFMKGFPFQWQRNAKFGTSSKVHVEQKSRNWQKFMRRTCYDRIWPRSLFEKWD